VSKPKIIKRYQNRKLYDTESSRYVTLDDIAAMIKAGEDVKVVDNKTRDDLTSITLTQIIFEEEKKHKSILPLDSLKRLIRSGGESLTDIYGKVVQPGLSSVTSARDDFENAVKRMVKRGKLDEAEGSGLISDIKQSSEKVQKKIDASWQQVLEVLKGVALLSRDVTELEKEVERLTKEVADLKKKKARS
jgi:polyhydroxyalkanoate synthesis repressor PhaR